MSEIIASIDKGAFMLTETEIKRVLGEYAARRFMYNATVDVELSVNHGAESKPDSEWISDYKRVMNDSLRDVLIEFFWHNKDKFKFDIERASLIGDYPCRSNFEPKINAYMNNNIFHAMVDSIASDFIVHVSDKLPAPPQRKEG